MSDKFGYIGETDFGVIYILRGATSYSHGAEMMAEFLKKNGWTTTVTPPLYSVNAKRELGSPVEMNVEIRLARFTDV